MKRILFVLTFIALPATLFAQGQIILANGPGTLFTTNGGPGKIGLMAGPNAYRIGLYTAPAGTMNESLFTLVLVSTNSSTTPGRIGTSTPIDIPANAGTPIGVQVKAWSSFAGATYEAAVAAGPSVMGQDVYAGKTPIGTVTPAIGGAPIPIIFGDVFTSGIVLYGPVPEPSAFALAALGVLVLFGFCQLRAIR